HTTAALFPYTTLFRSYCCSGSWKVLTYRFDLTIGEQHVSIFQDACFFIGPHSCVFDQGGLCLWQGLIAIGDKRIDHISINGQVRSLPLLTAVFYGIPSLICRFPW